MRKLGLALVFSVVLFAAIIRLWGNTNEAELPVKVSTAQIETRKDLPRPSAKIISPKPVVSAEPLNSPRNEFSDLITQTVLKLHRSDNESQPGSDTHFRRAGLFDTTVEFGAITDSLRKDNSLIPEGTDFYRHCARDEEVSRPIRAVCLRNLRYWAPLAVPPIAVDDSEFPTQIKDVAGVLSRVP